MGEPPAPGIAKGESNPTHGPLRACPENPRYFADRTGRAVYLSGTHTWNNLQHNTVYPPVDYPAYVALMRGVGHNFMRMWAFEQAAWDPWTVAQKRIGPLPFARTGPDTALDGGPKYHIS